MATRPEPKPTASGGGSEEAKAGQKARQDTLSEEGEKGGTGWRVHVTPPRRRILRRPYAGPSAGEGADGFGPRTRESRRDTCFVSKKWILFSLHVVTPFIYYYYIVIHVGCFKGFHAPVTYT